MSSVCTFTEYLWLALFGLEKSCRCRFKYFTRIQSAKVSINHQTSILYMVELGDAWKRFLLGWQSKNINEFRQNSFFRFHFVRKAYCWSKDVKHMIDLGDTGKWFCAVFSAKQVLPGSIRSTVYNIKVGSHGLWSYEVKRTNWSKIIRTLQIGMLVILN